MKRVFILAVFLIIIGSFIVIADSDDLRLDASVNSQLNSGQNSDDNLEENQNSEDDNDSNDDSGNEAEFESEIKSEGDETEIKQKYKVEYPNGTKVSYEYEIKKKGNLTEEQIQNIIQARNRIRVQYQNQSECPINCSCSGSTIKCILEDSSRTMNIYAGNSGNVIVQIKGVNSSTNVTLYKSDEGKVYGIFNDNETKEIILPDEVRERIQNKTKARIQNESIDLTEEGEYKIEAQKEAKLFWTIKVEEKVKARMNAETGEIISQRSSWWGFLAKDAETQ